MRALDSLSIAVSSDFNPEDPRSFSGWPAAMLGGVRTFTARAVPIDTTPGPQLFRLATWSGAALGLRVRDLQDRNLARLRLWTVAQVGRPMAASRAMTARRRLRAAGAVDGLVQMGAEYPAPRGLPMVTFQDSTLVQALRAYPWPHLQGLSAADIERNVRRQRAAYRSAVACCASSHWVAESLVNDYGLPPEKIRVVGLGANYVAAEPVERDWSRPRFLFVGGDWPRKNGPMLLEALARVRERVPDATLELVGRHPDVDDLPGVNGHGTLRLDDPAGRAEMEALYRSATAFVLPSLHEPMGTVHVEAAAFGIASIGTSNGGASTCIGDGGFVVDPTDPDGLVEAMCQLAIPEVARTLGERAARRAPLFTWRKVAERLVRALQLPGVDAAELADFL